MDLHTYTRRSQRLGGIFNKPRAQAAPKCSVPSTAARGGARKGEDQCDLAAVATIVLLGTVCAVVVATRMRSDK